MDLPIENGDVPVRYVNLPEDKRSYDLDDVIFIFDRIKVSSVFSEGATWS